MSNPSSVPWSIQGTMGNWHEHLYFIHLDVCLGLELWLPLPGSGRGGVVYIRPKSPLETASRERRQEIAQAFLAEWKRFSLPPPPPPPPPPSQLTTDTTADLLPFFQSAHSM